MAAGEVVLHAGHRVGAAEVGILATVGATSVRCARACVHVRVRVPAVQETRAGRLVSRDRCGAGPWRQAGRAFWHHRSCAAVCRTSQRAPHAARGGAVYGR